MAKFDIASALARVQKNENLLDDMLEIKDKKITYIPYNHLHFGKYMIYGIDQQEVEDLIDSLLSVGLEQNLVVKETDQANEYEIVSGHKRLTAINKIFADHLSLPPKIRESLMYPACIVIPKNEDERITRLRMHETNVQGRAAFSFQEVEDYFNTINEIKAAGITLNGHTLKGKSREILMKHFNFSDGTAKKYISILKSDNSRLREQVKNNEISVNTAYAQLTPSLKKQRQSKTKTIKTTTILKNIKKETAILETRFSDLSEHELLETVRQISQLCESILEQSNK